MNQHFQNGCEKARQEIENKLSGRVQNAGLYTYTFSDGTYTIAETIEQAVQMQQSQGRSTRVVKREKYRGL